MYNFFLILLLIAVAKVDCRSNILPAPNDSSLAPNPDGDQTISYPFRESHEQDVAFENEPPPEGYRPNMECKPNKTNLTAYPHFVRVEVTRSQSQVNTHARNYPIFGALHGIVVSKNYVLWSGSICDECTYTVEVGEGGYRLNAKPIPYSNVRNDKTNSNALVLLELQEAIILGPTVRPVLLPSVGERSKSGDLGMLVGPTLSPGSSTLNLSNRTVLNQQDCNEQISRSIKKWSYQVISPPGPWEDVTKVPKSSLCAVDVPESACPVVDSPVIFIKDKLAGIQYHEVYVFFGSDGSVDYQFFYDIVYYRAWIKNVTGV